MKHEAAALLSSWVDSELSPNDAARVEGHLKSCAPCRQAAEILRHTKRVLSSAPRRAMPADLVAAIERRLSGAVWLGWTRQPRVWAPATALALAGALITIWMQVVERDPSQYVPLEPLLTAHSRYSAESLVPADNLVASSYSTLSNGEQDQE